MSKSLRLRVLVNERLSAAAEEIFALFESTIAEYEEELCRFKEENQRKQEALDSLLCPRVLLPRALPSQSVSRPPLLPHLYESINPTVSSGVQTPVRTGTLPDVIKEEPEEQSLKEETLQVIVPESSYVKTEDLPLFSDSQEEDTKPEDEPELFPDNYEWRPQFSTETDADDDNDLPTQALIRARHITGQNPAPETSTTVNKGNVSGTADGAEGKKHQCSICKKRFSRNRNLQIHLRLHSGEKPHICSFCNKTFAQIAALKYHLITHTGEVPLSCPICDRGFKISSHLKAHMTTHTGEKPYSCSFCNRSFAQKTHLNVHRRTHTGEKPFTCPLCKKKYLKAEGLQSHMETHM